MPRRSSDLAALRHARRLEYRDVVSEVMDTVARLEASSERHADALEALAGQMAKTTAHIAELRQFYAELAMGMRDMADRLRTVAPTG